MNEIGRTILRIRPRLYVSIAERGRIAAGDRPPCLPLVGANCAAGSLTALKRSTPDDVLVTVYRPARSAAKSGSFSTRVKSSS